MGKFDAFKNERLLSAQERTSLIEKFAGPGDNRNAIEKGLKKARSVFTSAKQELDKAKANLAHSEKTHNDCNMAMDSARKNLVNLNRIIHLMDLTGADGVKEEKDGEHSFFINNKRFHLDDSDVNDVKAIPWKDYKSSKDVNHDDSLEFESIDGDDEGDYEVSDDDLVDAMNSIVEDEDFGFEDEDDEPSDREMAEREERQLNKRYKDV